ncbi:MAG: tetratricopeptide repeat protein, partial [Bacteroidota bacterium]
ALLVWRLITLLFHTPQLAGKTVSAYSTSIAFFTAWLFVAHPVMTEAVTYIVQRFVLLSSCFYLISLVLFLRGAMTNRRMEKVLFFAGSLLSAVLSFFTKETSYTLPLMLFLVWFFFIREKKGKWLNRNVVSSILIVLGAVVVTLSLFAIFSGKYFGEIPPREGRPYSIAPLEYYYTQLNVLITCMKLVLFPVNQTFDYNYPISQSLFESRTPVSFLMIILLLLLAVYLYKRNRLVSFGILWFFITISPQSLVPRPNVIFEHRVYMSAIGIILIWVIFLFYLAGKIRILSKSGKLLPSPWSSFANLASLILIIQVLVFACFTCQLNNVWKTELSLWTDCLEKAPTSARSWTNLGVAWHKNRDFRKAVFHFDQALRIFPQYLQALNNRGASRMALEEYPSAIADFTRVITLNGDFPEAWANRGIARRRMQQYAPAIEDFTTAISMDSVQSGLYLQRGFTYWLTGRKDSALADIQRAVQLGNQDAEKLLTNILKE